MSFLARRLSRRLGPLGVALTAYEIWTRLPKKEQKHLIALARKHGTRSFKVIKQHSAKIQSRFA